MRQDLRLAPDHPELYGTVVNVNSFAYELRFAGHPILVHSVGNRPVNDLQIVVFDSRDSSDICIEFFGKPATIRRRSLSAHLNRFLALVSRLAFENLERPLRELEILDAFERHALIEGYNQTAREVRSRTLPGLFEECVASDPARLAVLDSEGGLTYGELNARAINWRII